MAAVASNWHQLFFLQLNMYW